MQLPEMMAVLSQLKLSPLTCLSLGRNGWNGWGPVGHFSLSTQSVYGVACVSSQHGGLTVLILYMVAFFL